MRLPLVCLASAQTMGKFLYAVKRIIFKLFDIVSIKFFAGQDLKTDIRRMPKATAKREKRVLKKKQRNPLGKDEIGGKDENDGIRSFTVNEDYLLQNVPFVSQERNETLKAHGPELDTEDDASEAFSRSNTESTSTTSPANNQPLGKAHPSSGDTTGIFSFFANQIRLFLFVVF